MPTLKQRKCNNTGVSHGAIASGAEAARAAPPRQGVPQHPPQQLQPRPQEQAGDAPAPDQQRAVDGPMMAGLGHRRGGSSQGEPWPPLPNQRGPPPPPPPRAELATTLARMEKCPRCHLRTWTFIQDPLTGALRTIALTIPGEVYNGRCLLCFPLPNGFAGAASSVISNDDNGSDQGKKVGAVNGAIGPSRDPDATESVVDEIAPATTAAQPSDPDIAEEEQVPAYEQQPEDGRPLEDLSREDASSKSPCPKDKEKKSAKTATGKPIDDTSSVSSVKNDDRRKRKNDSPADKLGHGIKRHRLRSRSPKPPNTSAGSGKRTISPKRRQKSKASQDVVEKIRAATNELLSTNTKQVRCLKRLLSLCRTAGSPEKEEFVVSHVVRLRGAERLLALMKREDSSEVFVLICEVLLVSSFLCLLFFPVLVSAVPFL
jgi:hypothetical protein